MTWRDPVTDVYTAWEQHEMGGALAAVDARFAALARADGPTPAALSARRRHVLSLERRLAASFSNDYAHRTGAPIGRIRIHRIGLSTILAQSTDYWSSLTKGPGHYGQTPFPGQGRTIGIAGHRTTWSAPRSGTSTTSAQGDHDRAADALRHVHVPRDRPPDRGGRTTGRSSRNVGHEAARDLGGCHPLYSASHRYVVFARLAVIAPPGGTAVAI